MGWIISHKRLLNKWIWRLSIEIRVGRCCIQQMECHTKKPNKHKHSDLHWDSPIQTMKHLCLQVTHINVPISADYEVQHGCRQSMGQYTLSGVVHRADTPVLKVIFISHSVKGASRPSAHSPAWQVEKPPCTDWMNEARMSRKAYSGTWILVVLLWCVLQHAN